MVRPEVCLRNRQKRVFAVVLDSLPADINTSRLMEAMEKLNQATVPLDGKRLNRDKVNDIEISGSRRSLWRL